MKKNKKQQKIQETLSSIDSVLAALNNYPVLEDALLEKAQSIVSQYMGQFAPTQLDFAKDILEHLIGTDALIKVLSWILVPALPEIEIGLKTALLANMQQLGANCNIDPIIYEKAIKEGVVFDLRQIDLYDKLTVSPLDEKIGQYYYFGVEDCESSYDVLQSAISPNNQSKRAKRKREENKKELKEGTSYLNRALTDSVGHYFGYRKRDFDALLWYMKNKGVTRQVWGKRTSLKEDIFYGYDEENVKNWIKTKGRKNVLYYHINDGGSIDFYTKEGSKIDETKLDNGNTTAVVENRTYLYLKGGKVYRYKYGNAEIAKLNRKKIYVWERVAHTYVVFYFNTDGKIWDSKEYTLPNYESIETIPITQDKSKDDDFLKKDNFIVIDNSVYKITSDTKYKYINEKDKEKKVISSIKLDETIDITNDIKEDLRKFIDYDEDDEDVAGKTKGELIKTYGSDGVSSTFKRILESAKYGLHNNGKQTWISEEVKKDEKVEIEFYSSNLYYVDNDGDGKYDPLTDKVLIPPYINDFGKTYFGVNLDEEMNKKNRYTKDFGVLTLEYSPRSGNVLQSDGKPMQQQTPYDNVLHVFFGNVKEFPDSERDAVEEEWKTSSEANSIGQKVYKNFKELIEQHKDVWHDKRKIYKKEKPAELEANDKIFANAYVTYELLKDGTEYTKSKDKNGKDVFVSKESDSVLNVLPMEGDFADISTLQAKIEKINNLIDEYSSKIYVKDKKAAKTDDVYNAQGKVLKYDYNPEAYEAFINKLIGVLAVGDKPNRTIYTIKAYTSRIKQLMDKNESLYYLKANGFKYPEAKKNYYMRRTLFEFNFDYINSIQLFDPKVLAAQIISSLVGSATMDLMLGATASWKTELIRDTVRNMVEKEIASEDFAVSDCFFTFTNDAYNGMLRAAELRQAGLFSAYGEENGNKKVDLVKMLEGLNDLSDTADQAGQITVIEGALTKAADEIANNELRENTYMALNANFGVKMSFCDKLITNLCTQLVMAILSPKVYLLILINLELFGMTTNFDIKAFIQNFNNIIQSMVKSVVDKIMELITQKIKELIEGLIQQLIKKLAFEQVEMYARLIKQILMHLQMLSKCGDGLGWTQDLIRNADIKQSDTQEPIDEC